MTLIPVLLAGVLSILHYFSEELSEKVEKFHESLISFSAGLFITQIFLFLLPEFFEGKEFIGNNIFLLLVIGFVFFHATEKYIYQHIKNKDKLMKDLGEMHAFGFFLDNFVVGMALAFVFQTATNIIFAYVVFASLALHTIASSISLTHIDRHFNKNTWLNIILSISPLLGALVTSFLNPAKTQYHIIFSFVIGALLYVTIRDMVPKEKEGKVGYFLLGFVISFGLSMALGALSG